MDPMAMPPTDGLGKQTVVLIGIERRNVIVPINWKLQSQLRFLHPNHLNTLRGLSTAPIIILNPRGVDDSMKKKIEAMILELCPGKFPDLEVIEINHDEEAIEKLRHILNRP